VNPDPEHGDDRSSWSGSGFTLGRHTLGAPPPPHPAVSLPHHPSSRERERAVAAVAVVSPHSLQCSAPRLLAGDGGTTCPHGGGEYSEARATAASSNATPSSALDDGNGNSGGEKRSRGEGEADDDGDDDNGDGGDGARCHVTVWRAAAARSDVAGCPREHGQHRARQRPEPVCQEEAASQTAPRVREVKPPKAHRRKPLATTSCTQVCRALAIGSWLSALLSALRTSHVFR
jgi:hypothetical protein